MRDGALSSGSDPVAVILQSLPAIHYEYPAQRLEAGPDGALDATLRIVLSRGDFRAVSEFHAGLRDDEYGLTPAEGGRFLYTRLGRTVESHYQGLPGTSMGQGGEP